MPADRRSSTKPSGALAAAVTATGLLLAALGRRGPGDDDGAVRVRRREAGERRRDRDDTDHAPGPAAADAHGRGRHADAPAQIPARGWWEILKRTVSEISNDRVMTEAAGITFFALLALFPAIGAMISIYGLFAEPATINDHLAALSGFIPGGGMEIISEQVKRIAAKGDGTLGVGAVVGIATSLWSANAAMKALVDSLNVVYEEEERRGFFKRLMVTLALTVGGILFVLLAIGTVVVLPVVLNMVGLREGFEALLRIARWPLMLVAIGLFLAVVYRYGPSRAEAKWRWVSWGSGAAAAIWVIGSIAFSWYVTNFGNYNETYGSLGAAIGFMTWIWLSATVVLAGAELNAEMEHETARDTTTGAPRPMGARGARMADTVAP